MSLLTLSARSFSLSPWSLPDMASWGLSVAGVLVSLRGAGLECGSLCDDWGGGEAKAVTKEAADGKGVIAKEVWRVQ